VSEMADRIEAFMAKSRAKRKIKLLREQYHRAVRKGSRGTRVELTLLDELLSTLESGS